MSDVEKTSSETASADVPEERETDEARAVEAKRGYPLPIRVAGVSRPTASFLASSRRSKRARRLSSTESTRR